MLKIKNFPNQTYEEIEKNPNSQLCFFSNEKDLIEIIYLHFAKNIKQAIEYLTECSKFEFMENEIWLLEDEYLSIYLLRVDSAEEN